MLYITYDGMCFSCEDEFDALQALADLSASLLPGALMESGELCAILTISPNYN